MVVHGRGDQLTESPTEQASARRVRATRTPIKGVSAMQKDERCVSEPLLHALIELACQALAPVG